MKKLMIVRYRPPAAVKAAFPDFRFVVYGEALVGIRVDLVVVASPPETDKEVEWLDTVVFTRLPPNLMEERTIYL